MALRVGCQGLASGALFGAIVGFAEAFAAFATSGRFDVWATVAYGVYDAIGFAVIGLIAALCIGVFAGARGRRVRGSISQAPLLFFLLASLLVVQATIEAVFGEAFPTSSVDILQRSFSISFCIAAPLALCAQYRLPTVEKASSFIAASLAGALLTLLIGGPIAQSVAGPVTGYLYFGLVVAATGTISFAAARVVWSARTDTSAFVIGAGLIIGIAIRLVLGPGALSTVHYAEEIGARPPETGLDQPNVVLVVLDTLRADHLELYGYERRTMPSLTRFARRSKVFKNAQSTSPWTLSSHASLFTGLSPREHGAHGGSADSPNAGRAGHRGLSASTTTIAEVLRERGYRTVGIVGNWLFLGPRLGLHQGFEIWDSRASYRGAMYDGYFPFLFRARTILDALPIRQIMAPMVFFDIGQQVYRRADEITDRVLEQLPESPDEQERPFFLFVNYMDPHAPYQAPGRFADYFPGRRRDLPRYERGLERLQLAPDILRKHRVAMYDSELVYLDSQLQRLFARLEETRLLENTLVLITSDHGEAFGEHGMTGHGHSLYDEEVRVPLIIYEPGHGGGTSVDEPVSGSAIAPWLLRRLGASVEASPEDSNELARPGGFAIAELYGELGPSTEHGLADHQGIRYGSYKLLRTSRGDTQLFDIARDPRELQDAFATLPQIASDLLQLLSTWEASTPAADVRLRELSPEEISRLRALGYIR